MEKNLQILDLHRLASLDILERSRGRRRRENFNEVHLKAERNRARDKKLICNV